MFAIALKRSAAPLKMLKAGVCDAAAAGDVKVFKLFCARSIRDALRVLKNIMFMLTFVGGDEY